MDFAIQSFLEHEARALLTRLAHVQPFALSEPMVPAANLSPAAQRAIDVFLARGRTQLRDEIAGFLSMLRAEAHELAPADAQRRFSVLRLRFNASLTQFDLFADALSQRSARDHGVWLSGLDYLAQAALAQPELYETPPLVCYLDRGVGAAIRRARTRLPGGGENPVAVIRVPRERMLGSAVASSLVHECGHQASALLDLSTALRPVLRARAAAGGHWRLWERWLSEILADLWSVAKLGVAAALGMISVLSLPRPFVMRIDQNDPHPAPWLRVKLCCEFGQLLYPHPQWQRLFELWIELHPLAPGGELAQLAERTAEVAELLLEQRPARLHGRSLLSLLRDDALTASTLSASFTRALADPAELTYLPPCAACAVLGQARLDRRLSPELESQLLGGLLVRWALQNTLAAPISPTFIDTGIRVPEENRHGTGRDQRHHRLHA